MKRNVFLALMMVLFAAMFASCSPNPAGNVDSDLDIPGDPFENAPTEDWTDVTGLSDEERYAIYLKCNEGVNSIIHLIWEENNSEMQDDGKADGEYISKDGTIRFRAKPGYNYNMKLFGFVDSENNKYWGQMYLNTTQQYSRSNFIVQTSDSNVYNISYENDGQPYGIEKLNGEIVTDPNTTYLN